MSMSTVVGASASSLFSGGSNWIADTLTAIQNSSTSGGIMGALQNVGDGSINSFLGQTSQGATNLALIAQNSVTSASSFYAQIASANQQAEQQQQLVKALTDLQNQQQMVSAHSTLDPYIYFRDGTTIDTVNNIMTKPDGTQYDTVTGAKYLDPSTIIQMANGSYLNTKTNILTLSDGTQIDNVTHQKVSTTA
jgi:hypothetical protein